MARNLKIAAAQLRLRMKPDLDAGSAAALSPACTRLFVDGLDRGDAGQARVGLRLLCRGAVPAGRSSRRAKSSPVMISCSQT